VKANLHLAERTYECDSCGPVIDRDLNAAVNLARCAQHETDPSTGVVTGGADRKSSSNDDIGSETRTRADVGHNADDGGSASTTERLPEMPRHTNTHISGNGESYRLRTPPSIGFRQRNEQMDAQPRRSRQSDAAGVLGC
jgi:hypothetical protein